jgi:hypothetical protein
MVANTKVPPPNPIDAVNRLAIKDTDDSMAKSKNDKPVPSRMI